MPTKISITSSRDNQTTSHDGDEPEIVDGDASQLANIATKKSIHASACIYCGSDESLSNEHVIPYAFGGNLQIFNGSCESCRRKTSHFENFALNDGAMTEVRKARGLQSRSAHSSAQAVIKVALVKEGETINVEIETQDVPLLLGFPWFAPLALLTQRDSHQLSLDGWITTSFGPEVDAFLKAHGATELHIEENDKRLVAFAQTMAKIAYGYAWIDGIFDIVHGRDLVDAFMNSPEQLGAFVGMKQPPFERISGLDFRLEYRLKAPELLVYMEVQPFPDVPAPTYLVILGRCKDLRSWRHIRNRIRAGFE